MLTCRNCGRESPSNFAFCPSCAAPLTPATPRAESRKTVTVVFCDVTGSTALGERLDPEPLRDVQTRYFDAMRWAIERHGGTVEKYIGDAVMAVFGIPQLHEDDAIRAARAAVDMLEVLARLNKDLERDRGVTIQVRIGVNTGEVVAGDPVAGQAFVTGDAVNVAARLEQRAAPGEIFLGEDTLRLVRGAVDAEPVEALELKGKSEPVTAWRLHSVREMTSTVPRRLGSSMVGRESQLTQLRRLYEVAVEDPGCRLVTLLGSAGVGKSRLVEEFIAGLGGGTTVLLGRCLPYGDASRITPSSRRSSRPPDCPTSTRPRSSRPRSVLGSRREAPGARVWPRVAVDGRPRVRGRWGGDLLGGPKVLRSHRARVPSRDRLRRCSLG